MAFTLEKKELEVKEGNVVGRVYLANAFSLGMLSAPKATIEVEEVPLNKVAELLKGGFQSVVGHDATAQVLTELLGVSVPVNRTAIKLESGDVLVVFQLLARLPEGKVLTKDELEKIQYKFYVVKVL